jgi:hypothetical protein
MGSVSAPTARTARLPGPVPRAGVHPADRTRPARVGTWSTRRRLPPRAWEWVSASGGRLGSDWAAASVTVLPPARPRGHGPPDSSSGTRGSGHDDQARHVERQANVERRTSSNGARRIDHVGSIAHCWSTPDDQITMLGGYVSSARHAPNWIDGRNARIVERDPRNDRNQRSRTPPACPEIDIWGLSRSRHGSNADSTRSFVSVCRYGRQGANRKDHDRYETAQASDEENDLR